MKSTTAYTVGSKGLTSSGSALSTTDDRLTPAVFGVLMLLLVYLGRIQELFAPLAELHLGKIFFGLAILLFAFSARKGSVKLWQVPQFRYATWIFLFAVVSVPLSVWPGKSMSVMTDEIIKLALFFILVLKAVRSANDLKVVAWGIVWSVLLLGISTITLERTGRLSVSSTYDPNDLAFIMVMFIPLVYFLAEESAGFKKMFLFGVTAIMVVTILLTMSRGGFIGLTVVGLGIIIRKGGNVLLKLIPALLIALVVGMFAPDAYWDRMATMLEPEKDYNMQEGVAGRWEVWQNGMALMKSHPLFGVGIGGFETAEGLFHEGRGKWSAAHNSLIQIGAELGLIALALFILMIARSVLAVRLAERKKILPFRWLGRGVEVGLYGYAASGFFLSQAYSPGLYLLVALAVLGQHHADTCSPRTVQGVRR